MKFFIHSHREQLLGLSYGVKLGSAARVITTVVCAAGLLSVPFMNASAQTCGEQTACSCPTAVVPTCPAPEPTPVCPPVPSVVVCSTATPIDTPTNTPTQTPTAAPTGIPAGCCDPANINSVACANAQCVVVGSQVCCYPQPATVCSAICGVG
jgi:hypothetical protein